MARSRKSGRLHSPPPTSKTPSLVDAFFRGVTDVSLTSVVVVELSSLKDAIDHRLSDRLQENKLQAPDSDYCALRSPDAELLSKPHNSLALKVTYSVLVSKSRNLVGCTCKHSVSTCHCRFPFKPQREQQACIQLLQIYKRKLVR